MKKTVSMLFLLAASFLISTSSAFAATLGNYIGTGSNPNIRLELSANGAGWNTYNIGYKGTGNVPYSSDTTKQWSSWNVKDENNKYYGTLTLNSDGKTVSFSKYSAPSPATGYYLTGIKLNLKSGLYQLTVDKINMPADAATGPFPDAPLATPATYTGTSTPIVLSVSGPNIVNDKGKTILLKGLVRPSLEWNNQGQYLSVTDVQNMRNWANSNVLRINLNQDYWFASAPATTKGSYKQIINALVYYAIQNNMAVILDLHWINGRQINMADKQSIIFWQQVAWDYKDFGTVMFELYNEPAVDKNVWLNGNSQYAGYQQLYDAVRGTGAQNIVIANGSDWGYDVSFVNDSFKIKGANIVYGSHPYCEKGADNYKGPGGSLANNFKGILGKYPIIMTEFGVNQSSYYPNNYQAIYQRNLDYINSNNISYTGFAWWVDSDPQRVNAFPDIIKDWNGTPLNGGILIQNDMKAKPGTPVNTQ